MHRLQQNLLAKHLPGLDGFRAIAVLIVIAFHYCKLPVTPDGSHGVLVFFVLSGFLITWLLLKEHDESGGISLRDFYVRRARRILPAFCVSSVLAIGIWIACGNLIRWQEVMSAAAFVSNYYYIFSHQDSGKVLGITWSLAVEEQFYLLWPLLLITLVKKRRALVLTLCALIAGVWIYRPLLWFGFHDSWEHLLYGFDTRLDHLMIGCLGAIVLRYKMLQGFWNRVLNPPAMLAAAALLLGCLALDDRFGLDFRFGVGFMVEPVLVMLLMAQAVALAQSPVAAWLNWRPSQFLGKLSYSLYLYHPPALVLTMGLLPFARLRVTLPFAAVLLLALAMASFHYVEEPWREGRFTAGLAARVKNAFGY
jgi:peptidoglycan/LPS O-acetylase OafA/YrhL